MLDLAHEWATDIAVNSTGDIALASGSDVTTQRVYRRLLTNPGDYLWNLDYGAGLAQFVGLPANPSDIEAVIRDQLGLESAVATVPAPQVSAVVRDPANGYVVANISYYDQASNQTIQISVGTGQQQ